MTIKEKEVFAALDKDFLFVIENCSHVVRSQGEFAKQILLAVLFH